MSPKVQGVLNVVGRVMLCTIFFMSAVGNKIPNFSGVVGYMQSKGVPFAQMMLIDAIVFLIVGSLSVIVGYKARIGASMLLIFLVLATYYFHNFWALEGQASQMEMIQFMKNLSMAGAMVIVIANGSGPMSLDHWLAKRKGA